MTPEIKAAIERLQAGIESGMSAGFHADAGVVAEYFLSGGTIHDELDDDEPVTEPYSYTIKDSWGATLVVRARNHALDVQHHFDHTHATCFVLDNPTRGQLRRLIRALEGK